MLPMVMIGRQLLRSLIIGGLVAAPLYLWIMPGISQYLQLVPWLCIVFVPILYKMATSPPPTMIQYLFTAIFVLALLSLDEESQTYAFSSFVNMWFGLAGGFGCTIGILSLFSTIVPEHAFSQQVHAFFSNCSQFMQRIKQSAPGTLEGAVIVNTNLQQWQGTLRQLQMWPSVVDSKRVPGRDPQQLRGLVSSIEYLVLLLTSAVHIREHAHATLEQSARRQLEKIYDDCTHSLHVIADSLEQQQAIPDLPELCESKSLLYKLENHRSDHYHSAPAEREVLAATLLATSQLRAWVEAIDNCQVKANAIDWEAWNRNHL